jgi:outer membrane immunogenic protein
VIGIQGDLAGSSIGGGDQTLTDVFGNTNFTHFTVDTEWLASITGRFGYAWTPQTLIYIRGGVAWVREKWNFTSRHNSGVNLRDDEFSTSAKQTRTGWTLGGGIEYAFARNWTVFGEFNHYDFGRKDTATASASSGGCTSTTTFNTRQRIETVKGGVNYRFY